MSSTLPRKLSSNKSVIKLIVVAILTLFVVISAVPQYMGGWSWSAPLKLPQSSRVALQAMPEQGVPLSGWITQEQAAIKLGGQSWSIQQFAADRNSRDPAVQASLKRQLTSLVLLLRPQVYGADQPTVEWLDVKGSQGWETDSYQKIAFDLTLQNEGDSRSKSTENIDQNGRTVRINTDFFRAWSKEQTYAVLQWYAWPTGGSPSPAKWFWADQKVQWRRHQRMPWVAVSLWLPIEPLGDISPYQDLAKSLGKSVHQTLAQTAFQGTASAPAAAAILDTPDD
ncbi:MAG: cyanoexosortase B system-associated protein [Cyanobacteria bacterium J06598_3]